MIDIHSHVLHGIDDGSPNIETSIELIKYEAKQGVTDLFVTPHFNKFRGYLSDYQHNQKLFNELRQRVEDEKIDIRLHLGTEIYYDQHTLKHLSDKTVSPLGHSSFVLIEFSLDDESEDVPEAINNLTAKGYTPIIAHPERYPYMQKPEIYYHLRRMGAQIQINASSILGQYGRKIKKLCCQLIDQGYVDFVASDIHSFRQASLLDAYQAVCKKFDQQKAQDLFYNKKILK